MRTHPYVQITKLRYMPSRGRARAARAPALYLFLIIAAELIVIKSPVVGMVLHGLILVALIFHASLASGHPVHRLYLALSLAPLIRILSLSMPLARIVPVYWYGIVGIPLLIAGFMTIRVLGYSRRDVGLTLHNLPVQVLVALIGLPLGVLEYIIQKPQPLGDTLSFEALWMPVLIIVVGTGFSEELIFRGIMQKTVGEGMRRFGILYVSMLFAAMHIGYNNWIELLFVFAVGLFFASVVARTGSIIGTTLAHGLLNCALFLFVPLWLVYVSPVPLPQLPSIPLLPPSVNVAVGTAPTEAPSTQQLSNPPTTTATPSPTATPYRELIASSIPTPPSPTATPTATATPKTAIPTPTPSAPPSPTPTPSPAPVPQLAVVSGTGTQGANLRQESGLAGKVLRLLPEGTVLQLMREEATRDGYTWWKVKDPQGNIGWVASNSLKSTSQASPASATPSPTSPRSGASDSPLLTSYTVSSGDTLSAISLRFNTTVEVLMALNGLTDRSLVVSNQNLRVPTRPLAFHVVVHGETLTRIATASGTTAARIAELNGLKDRDEIEVGQRLVVPIGSNTRLP